MSKKNIIIVKRLPNGKVVQVMPDGTKRPLTDKTDWARVKSMTEKEIVAAAKSDADNPPLTNKELKKFKHVPNPREIRQRLHMTQEQFAIQFHVPLGTLRDWEQGAKRPDTAAQSYLRVIDKVPQAVMQALGG